MTALVLLPLVVLLVALVFGYFVPQRRRKGRRAGPIALAPFGSSEASLPPRPRRPTPPQSARAPAPATSAGTGGTGAASGTAARHGAAEQVDVPAPMPVVARAREADQLADEEQGRVLRLQVSGDRRDVVREEPRGAATLRLERPFDGTLQFLPGRLEVIEGRDVGQELRFVRTPGPDGTTVTFGRSSGPAYRHVQLAEPTVSRLHARMSLDGRTWSLFNLSATNPVVVNGLPLAGEGSSVVLREGDRIEMGEVVLRFRTK